MQKTGYNGYLYIISKILTIETWNVHRILMYEVRSESFPPLALILIE